ncbi:MAG: 6-phosphogluconolactonase [Acidobacteriaceae bacterium]
MPKTTFVRYHVKQDMEAMSRAAAEWIAAATEDAIAARGVARIAISGGNTPRRAFELLADAAQPFRARIDWSRLLLFWVDERCVPPDRSDSNYRMTREALLSKVPLPEANIVRMEGELGPEEAASRYESALRAKFRLEGAEVPRFDLIHLGMGDDGHTASLFPHSAALDSMMRLAVANHVQAKESWRLTLTWPVINHASKVFFLVQGGSKAKVLHDVLLGPYQPETWPSQLVRPKNGELYLLLDESAAAQLPAPAADGAGVLEVTR